MPLHKSLTSIFISSLLLVAASTAQAEEKRLSTSGYDMTDTADLHRLQVKIVKISRDMCIRMHKDWSYFYSDDIADCIRETTDNAVASTGHTGLQHVHDALPEKDRYDPGRDTTADMNIAGK